MEQTEKLRVLLPHWIDHNDDHAGEFRRWAEQAGPARVPLLAAAALVKEANQRLEEALEQLGGPLEHRRHEHDPA